MANALLLKPLPFSASSVHTGAGDPNYMSNDYAGVVWQSGASTTPWFLIDLGADTPVDTLMLFGLRGGGNLALAEVQVFGATAAEGPSSRPRGDGGRALLAGSVLPSSGAGVAYLPLPSGWPALRYLQVEFVLTAGALQVARAVLGRQFCPAINFEYGAQFGVRDLGSLDVNARGVLLRHRGKKLRTVSLNFPSLSKPEAEGTAQKLLEQVGNTECIALCTDAAPDAERQSRCYFGPLVGDLSRTWRTAAGHEVRVNLLGVM